VIVLFVFNVNMVSVLQKTRNLYNIATIDLIGLENTEYYNSFYGYVMTPYLAFTVLVLISYGNQVYGEAKESSKYPWFSWNSIRFGRKPAYIRLLVYLCAITVATSLSIMVFVYTIDNIAVAVLCSLAVVTTITYWSSSIQINHNMALWYTLWSAEDRALLVYLRVCQEMLELSAINYMIPYDFGGALVFEFHTLVNAIVAVMMLYTVGRDAAYIWDLTTTIWLPLLMAGLCAFVISYTSLFGIGAVFITSGALQNLPDTALVCSVGGAIEIFALSFVWTLQDVGRIRSTPHAPTPHMD